MCDQSSTSSQAAKQAMLNALLVSARVACATLASVCDTSEISASPAVKPPQTEVVVRPCTYCPFTAQSSARADTLQSVVCALSSSVRTAMGNAHTHTHRTAMHTDANFPHSLARALVVEQQAGRCRWLLWALCVLGSRCEAVEEDTLNKQTHLAANASACVCPCERAAPCCRVLGAGAGTEQARGGGAVCDLHKSKHLGACIAPRL